jgi:alkanesulfonate monooxygenase SsuD/methylene tetrahydromethanopterin reductase-like flavin-dependent oxidoreductase (luciferase family)
MTIFGVHASMSGKSLKDLTALWRHVDDLGYGWISVTDHFPGSLEPTSQEAGAAHAAMASVTKRARCAILCYSIAFRHPVVLASGAATVDQLSGGRAAIGIGIGSVPKDCEIYGFPQLSLRERMDMLGEGVACVAGLLREEQFDFRGSYFTIAGAHNFLPTRQRLPIWIGTLGERRGLPLVARYADGWNATTVSPEVFARKRELLHRYCAEAHRDPAEITCSANIEFMLGANRDLVPEGWRDSTITGTIDDALVQIQEYIDAGADQLNFHVGIMEPRLAGSSTGEAYPWDLEGLAQLATALHLPAI